MFYRKRMFLGFLVASGLLLSTPALGADVDDLKATFEKAVKAYNNQDDAWFTLLHDQSISFNPTAPFAIDGNAAYKESMKRFWASMESTTFKPINQDFRVIGSTGVAWGHYALENKPKDGARETHFGRYMVIFAKSGEKWLGVASHYSSIPSGN